MTAFRNAVAILVGTYLFCAGALAQNTISVASNLVHAGDPLPQSCGRQTALVSELLNRFPRPTQWRWVVLCDDPTWRQFLLRADVEVYGENSLDAGADIRTVYASTDLEARVTFLRGATLLEPDSPRAYPDHVIAHELAHIYLRTEDERRAERQAILWLRERKGSQSKKAIDGRTIGIYSVYCSR